MRTVARYLAAVYTTKVVGGHNDMFYKILLLFAVWSGVGRRQGRAVIQCRPKISSPRSVWRLSRRRFPPNRLMPNQMSRTLVHGVVAGRVVKNTRIVQAFPCP